MSRLQWENASCSYTATENTISNIELRLAREYGTLDAQRKVYPLKWYIYTGRACIEFIKRLNASPACNVCKALHNSGSDETVIKRVKKEIGFTDNWY